MILRQAVASEILQLTGISKAAFDTDHLVGSTQAGGPPGYDSPLWHEQMLNRGNLYTAFSEGNIVGGAILFPDQANKELYIGRIFVDPAYFRNGYGTALMRQIEAMFEGFIYKLDTPVWNVRTNRFYTKLGYREAGRDAETVYYHKL